MPGSRVNASTSVRASWRGPSRVGLRTRAWPVFASMCTEPQAEARGPSRQKDVRNARAARPSKPRPQETEAQAEACAAPGVSPGLGRQSCLSHGRREAAAFALPLCLCPFCLFALSLLPPSLFPAGGPGTEKIVCPTSKGQTPGAGGSLRVGAARCCGHRCRPRTYNRADDVGGKGPLQTSSGTT